ncbi:aldo/keto reductase [Siphonobacter sp. SORGH_AS_0500]|uniref:aldo/keto reductase n=1 Tax=Siphonobacter sp. SORGH_AS_0500 TaxID=1864824 RepID=UPI000CC6CDD5|nr:aldo/keto reductase [Siphonobacter sp. SORGH_AS_0500]MDR6193231.1 aryl-alcohol dehydrogenase-like predicted oxidoreductase [Siphonobacter sp. SORGH_AS_0500]PKK36702.1 aldo/keto reductase [Siphonobacter sp. SORGH_AS_0500]
MSLTDYRTLGKSGLRISPLTLGTMTFGEDWGWGTNPADAHEILDYYIQHGGNIIDTANIYTKGHSEKIIGDFLAKKTVRRDALVISTKFWGNLYPYDANGGGAGRKSIIQSLEHSLKRLQTDYIDLYWLHAFDPHTPIEETLSTLNDLVRDGKIRYIAISDTPAWKITEAQLIATFRGWSAFIGLQLEYSLLERSVENELIPMALEMGLGVIPWSPLKEGILSGKYTRGNKGQHLSGRNESRMSAELPEKAYQIIDQLASIASDRNVPVSAVAIAWVMHQKGITSTLLGARTMEQVIQNIQASELKLSDKELQWLHELSVPALPFPHNLLSGTADLLQAGTTVNGIKSNVAKILPQSSNDIYE